MVVAAVLHQAKHHFGFSVSVPNELHWQQFSDPFLKKWNARISSFSNKNSEYGNCCPTTDITPNLPMSYAHSGIIILKFEFLTLQMDQMRSIQVVKSLRCECDVAKGSILFLIISVHFSSLCSYLWIGTKNINFKTLSQGFYFVFLRLLLSLGCHLINNWDDFLLAYSPIILYANANGLQFPRSLCYIRKGKGA